MVVDDLEVLDGAAFARGAEVDLWLGFPRPLGVHSEVGGFADLNTWRDTRAGLIRISVWVCASLAAGPRWFLLTRTSTRTPRSPKLGSATSCTRRCEGSPVWFSPGPSARTFAASCDGSTFILKGLMGICCLNSEGQRFVGAQRNGEEERAHLGGPSPHLQTEP